MLVDVLLVVAGGNYAGRWAADGLWEGLVGRWVCQWQMDVGIWHSWLVAVPCLDDAGTGEPRQVDVFS